MPKKKYQKSGAATKTAPSKNTQVIKTAWGSVEMELKPKTFTPTLPKLPYNKWLEVCSFLKHCQEVHKGEGIVSLTLIGNKWHTICWFQKISGSLHVKYDPSSEENQALLTPELEEALANIHCTIHSHNCSSAFQSGDDKDDELQKIGWHITVGTMNKTVMDSHGRWNLNQIAKRDSEGNKISNAMQAWLEFQPETIVEEMNLPKSLKAQPGLRFSHKDSVHATPTGNLFPEEWKKRPVIEKPTPYSYPRTNPMLPKMAGHSLTVLPRDEGSDYSELDFNEATVEELTLWAKVAIYESNTKKRDFYKMHALAQRAVASKVPRDKLSVALYKDIKKSLNFDIAEDDAVVIGQYITKVIMDYAGSFEYSYTKFQNYLEKKTDISSKAVDEYLATQFQGEFNESETSALRDGLKQILGNEEVDKLSDEQVLLYYQP